MLLVIFDTGISMKPHCKAVCKTAYHHFHIKTHQYYPAQSV